MLTGNDSSLSIRVRDLSFAYDAEPVVTIESLDLDAGRITALIGPNGCGKTTFFKLLAGLLAPGRGTIELGTTSIATPAGRETLKRRCVYVHQKPYIFMERVRENVAYGLRVRGVPRTEWPDRLERALSAVGIAHLRNRPARGLSGGERQRLAIARAIALEPSLLLLDEPTSNVDPVSIRIIERAMSAARESGMTVLVSTHNLATAYRVADSVYAMDGGAIAPDRHNVYRGTYRHTDEATGTFSFDDGYITTAALDGTFTAAVIPMDDVILATGVLQSSAQNHFTGKVIAVTVVASGVQVDLDCGFPLRSIVTARAVTQLNVRVGTVLSASFKASAVRLY